MEDKTPDMQSCREKGTEDLRLSCTAEVQEDVCTRQVNLCELKDLNPQGVPCGCVCVKVSALSGPKVNEFREYLESS